MSSRAASLPIVLHGAESIRGVQLSVWTNVAGPSILKQWRSVHARPEEGEGELIARETLQSALQPSRPSTPSIHVTANMALVSVCFDASYGTKNRMPAPHALALVLDRHRVKSMMNSFAAVEDRVDLLAAYVQSLLNACSPDKDDELRDLHVLISADFRLQPLPRLTLDQDFLAKAITSHLQTGGFSVVVGSSPRHVDEMVDILSLFLSPNERILCARTEGGRGFVPDLHVQGILLPVGATVASCLNERDVLRAIFPISLVDVDGRGVYQSWHINAFAAFRQECRMATVEEFVDRFCREAGLPSPPHISGHKWIPPSDLFCPTKASPFVNHLVEKAMDMSGEMTAAFVAHSLRILSQKAAVLVHYVQSPSFTPTVDAHGRKKIRDELEIGEESEELILFAVAEKLHPGIYTAVAGRCSSEAVKVLQFFESL